MSTCAPVYCLICWADPLARGEKERSPIDRRLCLVIMRPPLRKRGQRKIPEQIASSATLEVISTKKEGGRAAKKRILEATESDPRASPLPSPIGDSLHSQFDPSQPSDKKNKPNVSRSVSVSVSGSASSSLSHLFAGQSTGVDSARVRFSP